MPRHFERALFVIGDSGTGKSTQLRSLFRDWRFGTKGEPPTSRNIPETYWLSNERGLYLRLTSPHEWGEGMDKFLAKCNAKMYGSETESIRWNFACPLHIRPSTKLLGAVQVVTSFCSEFSPERIRVVILSPNCSGVPLDPDQLERLHVKLRAIPRCEVMVIDAMHETANGLILADFFDFT